MGHVDIFLCLRSLHLAVDGNPAQINLNITPKANYARILIPVTPDPTFTISLVIEKLERNSGCTV